MSQRRRDYLRASTAQLWAWGREDAAEFKAAQEERLVAVDVTRGEFEELLSRVDKLESLK